MIKNTEGGKNFSLVRRAEIWAGEIAASWLGCKLKNGRGKKNP